MPATFAFDLWDAEDPKGTFLVRLTVGDQLTDGGFHRVFGYGDGFIEIHGDHPDAQYIHRRAWVQVVRTDTTPDRYKGGFFLEEGDFRALSKQEKRGRLLTFRGRGGLSIVERYSLGHSVYAPGQAHRGDIDVPGKWHWENEPYGAMAVRFIEEGKHAPGSPLAPIAYGFTRARDSDNLQWGDIADYETDILTDGGKLFADLMRLGVVFDCTADLLFLASRSVEDFGTDRSSATFAAGKVRFEAGQNIAQELPKRLAATLQATHVTIRDRTGDYQTVDEDIDGNPLPGPTTYVPGGLKSNTTADDAAIWRMGQLHLTARQKQADQCRIQHVLGPGGASGADGYDAGPAGDYDIGDIVTVHTGTGEFDYDEQPIEVAGIRWFLKGGTWMVEAELGAQYVPPAAEAVAGIASSTIRDVGTSLKLCQPRQEVDAEYELVGVSVSEHNAGDAPSTLPNGWAAGMVAIAHARFDGSGGPHIPTPPAGWTGIGLGSTGGGPVAGIGQRGAWRLLDGTETDAGTWTHGRSVMVVVFRGLDTADPIGAIAGSTSPSGQLSWSALTLEVTDGSSRVISFGVHKSDAIAGDAMSGTEAMSPIPGATSITSGVGDHGAWISDAGVTAWGAHTVNCTNDDRQATSYELRAGGAITVTGDGLAVLVGTSTSVKRCDDTEHYHAAGSASPTVDDDGDAGFRLGTLWVNDDGEAWLLVDVTAGAAEWIQFATGGGGGGGSIPAGTSFPGSPATDDLFHRTDRDLVYFYDGTRWLTVNEYDMGIGWAETAAALSGTQTLARWPVRQDYGMFLTRWNVTTFMTNGTPGTNNMTVVLARVNGANTATTIASFVNNADSASNWVSHDQVINAVLDSSARILRTVATEAGTVTGFICAETISYRLIG
jgi:hypothetical protein